jgi:hypothetical protein
MGRCGGLVKVMLESLVVAQCFGLVSTTDRAGRPVNQCSVSKLFRVFSIVGR